MPSFAYIARTNAGTLERGSLTAPDAEEAREILRKRNLFVEELQTEQGQRVQVRFPPTVLPWSTTETDEPSSASSADLEPVEYVPLLDTLRLFAGWLLAWYAVVYLIGSFQRAGKLPSGLPFVEGLFLSPLVLRFAFGTYLFLLLTSLHRILGGGVGKGLLLTVVGVAMLVGFHIMV